MRRVISAYTLSVNNAGPDTASNVSVSDTLPVGVTLVSASRDRLDLQRDRHRDLHDRQSGREHNFHHHDLRDSARPGHHPPQLGLGQRDDR